MRDILRLEQHRSAWDKNSQDTRGTRMENEDPTSSHASFALYAVRDSLSLARSDVTLDHAAKLLRQWGDLLANEFAGSPSDVYAVEDLGFAQGAPMKFRSTEDTLESLGRALKDVLDEDGKEFVRRLPLPKAGTSLSDPLVATSMTTGRDSQQM